MRAPLEETFYNVDVSADDFWRDIGEELLKLRHRRQWLPTDVEKNGGPSYKTVQAIEHGKIGNLQSLEQHA